MSLLSFFPIFSFFSYSKHRTGKRSSVERLLGAPFPPFFTQLYKP